MMGIRPQRLIIITDTKACSQIVNVPSLVTTSMLAGFEILDLSYSTEPVWEGRGASPVRRGNSNAANRVDALKRACSAMPFVAFDNPRRDRGAGPAAPRRVLAGKNKADTPTARAAWALHELAHRAAL